jgi:hypothetical protein
MKMVKSLLLGSAAGLVALSGAQAADLPVKAKPVQYVKICSLYGAGFYYIPGTDTCLKVGGFVRAEMNFRANGSFGVPLNANYDVRTGNQEITRTRIIMSFDARSQTEYGTLRSYGRGGWQWSSGDYQVGGSQGASSGVSANTATGAPLGSSSTTYFDRAFVQLAGFTAGKTQSFFDFFNAGLFSNQTPYLWMDTGGSGTPVFAYTATFGNGLSATISAEEYSEQALPIVSVNTPVPVAAAGSIVSLTGLQAAGTDIGSNHANDGLPDIVANIRADQTWGSAQIQGALHDNRATYYTGSTATVFASPADAWGYGIGGGVSINLPMLGKGDVFSVATNYCHGASRYCSNPNGGIRGAGNLYAITDGGTVGFANLADAYFAGSPAGGTGLELPNAWNVEAGVAHHWNANWQSSLYGGYLKYTANSSAADGFTFGGANTCAALGLAAGCHDFAAWQIGTRLLWNPVANLDISLEALYHHVDGAMAGRTAAGSVGSGTALVTYGNLNEWSGIFRVQRNFYP